MKKLLKIFAVVLVFVAIFFLYLIWDNQQAKPDKNASAEDMPSVPVDRYALHPPQSEGEYIARAADCVACHTAPGGQPYAGGLAMKSPFGTIYSTNITPDKEHGIGEYSLAEFSRAVRDGVRKDGHQLYPAMPYTAYHNMSDEDIESLYNYLMGLEPVARPNLRNPISFPFDQRWGINAWKLLATKELPANKHGDAELDRGAYLVETLGHCGSCHTPRNLFFVEKGHSAEDAAFLTGGDIDGWHAPDLRHLAALWDTDEMVTFLATGRNEHGSSVGEMSVAIEHGLQYLSDEDLHAMAAYLKHIAAVDESIPQASTETSKTTQRLTDAVDLTLGERLYSDNCLGCHFADGRGAGDVFPPLDGNVLVNADNPHGLLHVILHGARLPSTQKAPAALAMPGFGDRLDDEEAAALASFLRQAWHNQAGEVTVDQVQGAREE